MRILSVASHSGQAPVWHVAMPDGGIFLDPASQGRCHEDALVQEAVGLAAVARARA